jgi:hypothetical protein
MKKLKLELDALEVESFAFAEELPEAGTVRGQDGTSAGVYVCQDGCATADYTQFCESYVWACIDPEPSGDTCPP